jgi:hypothetical protein
MKITKLRIEESPARLMAMIDGINTTFHPRLPELEAGYVGLMDEEDEWSDRLRSVQVQFPGAPEPMTLRSHTDDPVAVCVARRFLATVLGVSGAAEYAPGPQPLPTEAEAVAELKSGRFGFPAV